MLQFYFLSVLLNAITGIVLVFSKESSETPSSKYLNLDFFEHNNVKLILGIMTAFTAIMKMLSVVPNDVPVAGDLLPVVAGALGGISMLISYYTSVTNIDKTFHPLFEKIFITGKRYIGFLCLVAALLHFLFPKVLFF